MASSRHPFRARAEHLEPLRLPICHEILVYTAEELDRLRKAGNFFVVRALEEGVWVVGGEGHV